MKKSIILSLLLMVAGLSVPARMNAMLWPAVKIGLAITAGAGAISVSGVGLGICLWNKYLWINKPKRRMEQNKIHLMTDNLQKLSWIGIKYPKTIPLIKKLVKLPPNPLYGLLFKFSYSL